MQNDPFGIQSSAPLTRNGLDGPRVTVGPRGTQVSGPGGPNARMTPLQVRQLQSFLRNQGYQLNVDGIYGPLTDSAKQDFQAGAGRRNPNRWNSVHIHGSPVAPKPAARGSDAPAKQAPVRTPAAAAPVAPKPAVPVAAPAGGGMASIQAMLRQLMGGQTNTAPAMDPRKIAQAAVDAQFGPQIASAQRTIDQTNASDAVKNQHLMDWFSQLVGASKDAGAQAAQEMQAILGSAGASDANIANAISDPAAKAQFGITSGIDNSALAKTQAVDLGRLFADAPINALKGTEALSQATQAENQNVQNLKAQLQDLLAQKGAAYTGALQQAYQNQDAQANSAMARRSEVVNQLATMLMLPGQLQGQKQSLLLQALQGNQALQQGAVNLKNSQLDAAMRQVQINQAKKAGAAGGKQAGINYNDPSVVTSLSQGAYATIAGPKGNFVSDPRMLWNSIIQQYGWKNNSAAKRILSSVFTRVLAHSHIAGEYRHVRMTPNGPSA